MSRGLRFAGLLMTAAAAHFLLCLIVHAALLARLSSGQIGLEGLALITLKPLLLAAAAAALLLLWRRRPEPPAWARAAILAGFAATIAAYLLGPYGLPGWDALAKSLLPAVAAAFTADVLARRRVRPLEGGELFAATLAGAAAIHALFVPYSYTIVNSLGLVSSKASVTEIEDYSGRTNKDHYPTCTFRYNSLGYRGEEPPSAVDGRRRVLLVGDSYVWGDGIPSNEQTLGGFLAAELERTAPGRYDVISAAYPGLGLYGYGRLIGALEPRYRPEVVVVGYLGESDHDPLDPQLVVDALPAGLWARNLVVGLRVARHICEASEVFSRVVWGSPENKAYFDRFLGAMSRRAEERGYRLVFLSYFDSGAAAPAPAETLNLPAELRYPGRASDLWYARDFHPKPRLNAVLARRLAERIRSRRPA